MAWLSRSLLALFKKKYPLKTNQLQHTFDVYEKFCGQLKLDPATCLYILAYMEKQLDSFPKLPTNEEIQTMFLGSAIIAAKMVMDNSAINMPDLVREGNIINPYLTLKKLNIIERDLLFKFQYAAHIKDMTILNLLNQYFDKSSLSELLISLIKERTLTRFRFRFLVTLDKLLIKNDLPTILNTKDKSILLLAEHINQFPRSDWNAQINNLEFDEMKLDPEYFRLVISLISLQKPEERMQIINTFNLLENIKILTKPCEIVLLKELFSIIPIETQLQLVKANSAYIVVTSNEAFQSWMRQFMGGDLILFFQINESIADDLDAEKVKLVFVNITENCHHSFHNIFPIYKLFTSLKDIHEMLHSKFTPFCKSYLLIKLTDDHSSLIKRLMPTEFTPENIKSKHNEIFDIIILAYQLQTSGYLNQMNYILLCNRCFDDIDITINFLIHSDRPSRENLIKKYLPIATLRQIFLSNRYDLSNAIQKIKQLKEFNYAPEIYLSLLTGLINVYKSIHQIKHVSAFFSSPIIEITNANKLIEAVEKRIKSDVNITKIKDNLGEIATIYNAYLERTNAPQYPLKAKQ